MIDYTKTVRDKFLLTVREYKMLDDTRSVVVGFSGGADSVCLLHLLKSYESEMGYKTIAAHVNHGIRGDEALRDQLFCETFCEENDVPFYIKEIDCIGLACVSGKTLEECGREERYCFFDSLCDASSRIATAHNANDNAETVIFNLCRGSALKGARGIPPTRDNIIRPIILCSREEIEGYCNENNLQFVTDSTNSSDEYTRNKIRHNVLPVLSDVNSAYLDKFSDFSKHSSEVADFIKTFTDDAMLQIRISENVYDANKMQSLHKIICYECIVEAFSAFCDRSLDRRKIDEIYGLLSKKGRVQIYGNIFAEVLKGHLRFFFSDKTTTEPISFGDVLICGKYELNGFSVSFTEFSKNSKNINKNLLDNLIDCDKIFGNVYLGTRREGDKFTFHNRKVTKSLKKLFNELNIPIELRDKTPVLYDDYGVIWVMGVGVDERCRVNSDSSDIILVVGEK